MSWLQGRTNNFACQTVALLGQLTKTQISFSVLLNIFHLKWNNTCLFRDIVEIATAVNNIPTFEQINVIDLSKTPHLLLPGNQLFHHRLHYNEGQFDSNDTRNLFHCFCCQCQNLDHKYLCHIDHNMNDLHRPSFQEHKLKHSIWSNIPPYHSFHKDNPIRLTLLDNQLCHHRTRNMEHILLCPQDISAKQTIASVK